MTEPTAEQAAHDARCRVFVDGLLALHTITFYPAFGAEMCACGLPARDCEVQILASTCGFRPARHTWTDTTPPTI